MGAIWPRHAPKQTRPAAMRGCAQAMPTRGPGTPLVRCSYRRKANRVRRLLAGRGDGPYRDLRSYLRRRQRRAKRLSARV
jgi:hypothetical protein